MSAGYKLGALSIYSAEKDSPESLAIVYDDQFITFSALAQEVRNAQRNLEYLLDIDESGNYHRCIAVVARSDFASIVIISAILEMGLVPCFLHHRWLDSYKLEIARSMQAIAIIDTEQKNWIKKLEVSGSVVSDLDFAIFFTSGTTSKPKAVRISLDSIFAAAEANTKNLGWSSKDRWLLNLPMAHVGGFSIFFRTRISRTAMVLWPSQVEKKFVPAVVEDIIVRYSVTLLSMVPTMMARIASERIRAPSSVRALLLGGAAAGRELVSTARQLGWPILTTYGMTETLGQISTQPLSKLHLLMDGEDILSDVGYTLEGCEVQIREGQIWVNSRSMMLGYLLFDEVNKRYLSEKTLEWDNWLPTRDLGEILSDGRLLVTGRMTDLIISGGENISPSRIEQWFLNSRLISDVVVCGVEDNEWGQRVAMAVSLQDEDSFIEIRRRIGLLNPIERPYYVWVTNQLPKLSSGKVDRRGVSQKIRSMVESGELGAFR